MPEPDMVAPMQLPPTRLTLIEALGQGIRWEEFVAVYGPVIFVWAKRDFQLQSSDAEDVQQAVLLRVWRHVRRYDASKGRFRNWLYVCVRNAVRNWHRSRHGEWVGEAQLCKSFEGSVPPISTTPRNLDEAVRSLDEEGFAHEDLQASVAQVRRRVQPATWKAFLLFEFFAMKAKDIGPLLGMTPVAVNQAVHRVRQLLRETWSIIQAPDRQRPKSSARRCL
jgi:RNA polymerase sigma factor (sigma-70 family)